MASIKKISSLSDWNSADSNRVYFSSNGTGKLFSFDHSFSGLSVDSQYWQILYLTGSPYVVDDGLFLTVDNENSVDYLRSRHYYSGDFDIYVSYEDLSSETTSTTRYLYFGLTDKSIDTLDNITMRMGIGIESSAVSISAEVLEDTDTTVLYSGAFAKNYTSGKLRIKRTGTLVEFYAEDATESWEKLGDFTDAAISAHSDMHLFFESRFDTSSSTDNFSVKVSGIEDQTVFSTYYGNVVDSFEFDDSGSTVYYSLIADSDQIKNIVAVRLKSAQTESGLSLATWSSYNTSINGSFSIGSNHKFFTYDIKLMTSVSGDSPVLDSIKFGLSEIIESEETPYIVAPSQNEVFDSILRILWKVPSDYISGSTKRYYKIEYKNDNVGINNWVLITNRADPDAGFFDWRTDGLEEDDNYQIRITTIFVEDGNISSGLPDAVLVVGSGENIDGVFRVVGSHNGENLYEGDDGFIYFDGTDTWYIGSSIDNESGLYYSGTVLGTWSVDLGASPAPTLTEYIEESSDESDTLDDDSSSSYEFSSTSTASSESSSTRIQTSSSVSSLSESTSSESTQILTSSTSSPSSSKSSKSSESSESSSSTERVRFSTSSSLSSSSTKIKSSSSSSTVLAILRGTGNNLFGQLGVKDFENRDVFTKVLVNEYEDFRLISSGAHHAFIQRKDGTTMVAGRNTYGQLGLGDNTDRNEFTDLSSDYDYAADIQCGEHYSVIKRSDGTVWVCGRNHHGQLGLGDNVDRNSFEQLPIKYTGCRKIAAGSEFMMIEKLNGYIDVVGANEKGQLGIGDEIDRNEFYETRIRLPRKMSAGSLASYYESSTGSVYSAGDNFHGQLGLGDNTNRSSFTQISGITSPERLVSGGNHVLIVDSSGILKGCGDNNLGQLGLGDNVDRNVFTSIGVVNPIQVRAGFHHTMAVASNGILYGTGYNFYGQLGLGHNNAVNSLTRISGYPYPELVNCGGYHTFLLTEFSESESSTERFDTSSSSWSVDDPILIYPYGYFQSSETNMADANGYFEGDSFYIPSNDISIAIMMFVSTSMPGYWSLEKADPDSSTSFSFHADLKIGAEVSIEQLSIGDIVRVVFDGPVGAEVLCYKVYFRRISEWSSSSSTQVAGSTSSESSQSSESSPSVSTSSTSTQQMTSSSSSPSSSSPSSHSSSTTSSYSSASSESSPSSLSSSSTTSSDSSASSESSPSSLSSSTQILSSSESSSSSTLLKSSTSTQYLPSSQSSSSDSSSTPSSISSDSSQSSESSPSSSSESSSSSTSVNEPVVAYPNGYFEVSATNLADASGDYVGNTVAVSRNSDIVMISYVASSAAGTWTVQRFNGVTYDVIATPIPGQETSLSTGLSAGDEYRILFDGPNGTELLSYRVDFGLS